MNNAVSYSDLAPLLPLGVLLLSAAVSLLAQAFGVSKERGYLANFSLIGFLAAIALLAGQLGQGSERLFAGALLADDFSRTAILVMMAAGLVVSLMSPAYTARVESDHGEYYALLQLAVVGMGVMTMAADLFTLFLGLETMSIAVYAMTALRPKSARSAEAAMKYFLMGAFATGFLVFGMTLVYGATGGVALTELSRVSLERPLLFGGTVLLLVGFFFKIAAVPFHMWAPDVYEGAPTPVAGFMAVGVKAAAFAALLKVITLLGGQSELWVQLLSGLAMLTIIAGNLLALAQDSVKRMLAYSSVSHAGYVLIGLVAQLKGDPNAGAAVLYYLTAYTFLTLGAFAVLAALERADGDPEAERYESFGGVGRRHPVLGLAMILFMIGLAGMPPTGGFFGKLYLFSAAIEVGRVDLAFVGILGSLISVYYYLRVLVGFYMRPEPENPRPRPARSTALGIALALSAFCVLALGVFPQPWLSTTQQAAQSLRPGPQLRHAKPLDLHGIKKLRVLK